MTWRGAPRSVRPRPTLPRSRGGHGRAPGTDRSRTGRSHPEIFVLMDDVVERVFVVPGDLKDADHPVFDVAVGIETDLALQSLDVARLDRVAHRVARHFLA